MKGENHGRRKCAEAWDRDFNHEWTRIDTNCLGGSLENARGGWGSGWFGVGVFTMEDTDETKGRWRGNTQKAWLWIFEPRMARMGTDMTCGSSGSI